MKQMYPPQMLETWLGVLMPYVIALRHSQQYLSRDISLHWTCTKQ